MTNNLWEFSLALVAKWYPSCLIRKFFGSIHYGWWRSVMLGIISFHLEEKCFMYTYVDCPETYVGNQLFVLLFHKLMLVSLLLNKVVFLVKFAVWCEFVIVGIPLSFGRKCCACVLKHILIFVLPFNTS